MQILLTALFIVTVILIITGSVLLVKLAVLLLKRTVFVLKFKRFCSVNSIPCTVNHSLLSVFHRGEEPDITVEKSGRTVEIFIFSTMFRHSRYHFLDNGRAEIYHMGRGVIPFLGRAHLRTFAAHPEGITRLSETRLMTAKGFTLKETAARQVILIHPIPLKVTRIVGNGPKDVYDGEPLIGDVRMYSGNGLRKFLISPDK